MRKLTFDLHRYIVPSCTLTCTYAPALMNTHMHTLTRIDRLTQYMHSHTHIHSHTYINIHT